MRIQIDVRPPSVNTYKTFHSRGAYISKKGREFKEYVEMSLVSLKNEGVVTSFGDARLKVEYEFHFKGKRKRDVDNYIKPLQDCMEGILFDDDEQIDEINAKRFYHCEFDYIIVSIEKL